MTNEHFDTEASEKSPYWADSERDKAYREGYGDAGIRNLNALELANKQIEALNRELEEVKGFRDYWAHTRARPAEKKLAIAVEALLQIRETDWGTDHCDAKNMLADEALARVQKLSNNCPKEES